MEIILGKLYKVKGESGRGLVDVKVVEIIESGNGEYLFGVIAEKQSADNSDNLLYYSAGELFSCIANFDTDTEAGRVGAEAIEEAENEMRDKAEKEKRDKDECDDEGIDGVE